MAKRVTLISDATKEFPNNQNNNFRMRIPNGLHLEGDGWHVAMLSLTLPNRTSHQFAVGHDNLMVRSHFSVYAFKNRDASTKKYAALDFLHFTSYVQDQDVVSATDGPSFWNNVVRQVYAGMDGKLGDYRSKNDVYLFVKKTMMPTFSWDGQDLIVHKRGIDVSDESRRRTALYSAFDIALEVALQWGLVKQKSDGTWVAGPNLQFDPFGGGDKITDSDPPRDSSIVAPQQGHDGKTLLGPCFRFEIRHDIPVKFGRITSIGHNSNRYELLWTYSAGSRQWLRLSGMVEWRFINLQRTYDAIHKHPNHAVMVYTNLQQSTIVGERTAQLLREIVVNETNEEGHSYAEPKQLQWIPIASRHTDIAEVQLADVNGQLLPLPSGKSLVTVAFKQIL